VIPTDNISPDKRWIFDLI